jgi:hypothetical protein
VPGDPIIVMERLSSEYGWTPDQIRNQRHEDLTAYLRIIRLKGDIQKSKQ